MDEAEFSPAVWAQEVAARSHNLEGAVTLFRARSVAFGERRERFSDAASLQKHTGVATVTGRSGNKSSVPQSSCSMSIVVESKSRLLLQPREMTTRGTLSRQSLTLKNSGGTEESLK